MSKFLVAMLFSCCLILNHIDNKKIPTRKTRNPRSNTAHIQRTRPSYLAIARCPLLSAYCCISLLSAANLLPSQFIISSSLYRCYIPSHWAWDIHFDASYLLTETCTRHALCCCRCWWCSRTRFKKSVVAFDIWSTSRRKPSWPSIELIIDISDPTRRRCNSSCCCKG